jgi:hypothetical protein
MLKFILSFLSGPISDISNDLKEAYQSKLNAQNDSERIAAEERINLLEARKNIILAAQSDPWERFIRIGFAIPCVLYFNKLILWDKFFGFGATDDLSQNLWNIFFIVLGGYFVDTIVRRFK